MKKLLIGTSLTVFALAPAMSWADCDFHNKASMASSKPVEKTQSQQMVAAGKASASAADAKVAAAGQVKQGVAKPTSKTDESKVLAKSN